MEVILNSDIASLVLGYLNDQDLHNVSALFCKHSPYLTEQNEVIKSGLYPINIKKDTLVQIMREYCHINSKINKTIETFPENVRQAFVKQNLIGKISYLLKLAKRNIVLNNIRDTSIKSDYKNTTNMKIKRRRSQILSDTNTSTNTKTTQCRIQKQQDAHSVSSGENSSEEPNDDNILDPISTENATISTSQQSSTIFPINTINEPPVIIDSPKPKSSIIFKTTAANSNNNVTSRTPRQSINSNQQQLNSICTSLNDPNASISKLIIMNPNDTTNESLFNNINNIGLSPFTGEQLFIDLGTGQTYPLLMTNDGMNCMFINRRTDIDTNNIQPILLPKSSAAITATTKSDIDESNNEQCDRVVSQSNREDGGVGGNRKKNATNTKNSNKIIKKKISLKGKKRTKPIKENDYIPMEKKQIDPLEDWRQMRLKMKSTNFDQHLREMAAKTSTVGHFRNNSRRRKRRKIGGNITRHDDINDQTNINDDDSPDNCSMQQLNDKTGGKKKLEKKFDTVLWMAVL